MRAWSGAANRGLDIPRDRDAEFTAPGAVADLLARAARVREAFVADVRAVDGDAAPTKQREDAKFWEATCHGVLLHVFEEVCQHLGHLEITRDAVTAGRPAS